MDANLLAQLYAAQQNEITEYRIYSRLARVIPNQQNAAVLQRIAGDEGRHYDFWKKHTRREAPAKRWKVLFFYLVARIFGITFGIKLMERGEEQAQIDYALITEKIPEAEKVVEDEHAHEQELIAMIEEERLSYVGSIVLGLNDALVELTGALAGFTFALQNTRLIALAGLITGIAASFSMAASEYLSNYFLCLALTLGIAMLIIFFFNFYISVAKDYSFRRRFLEMAGLSLGVAVLTFTIGFLIRKILGIEV